MRRVQEPFKIVIGKVPVRRTGGILTRRQEPKKGLYERRAKHRGRQDGSAA